MQQNNLVNRVMIFINEISVEPLMFMFSFIHGLYSIAAQTLYINKSCAINLNFSVEVCDNLFGHKQEQIEVQKYVSELQAYNGLLQSAPPVVYAMFAGPWSDIYGRRFIIIFSMFGFVINNFVFLVNSIWFHELRAEFLLFECLQDFTGGTTAFYLGCYSYLSDVSSKHTRTKRLAFLDGLFPLGYMVGMSISGMVKVNLGQTYNFLFGMLGALTAIGYATFMLKEKARETEDEEQETKKSSLLAMFDTNNLKTAFKTTFKKRPHGLRPYLLLIGFIFLFEIFLINGKGSSMFLYLRKEFEMDEVKLGKFFSFMGFVGLFTQYCAVPFFSETLKMDDTTISVFACLGAVIQHLIFAFCRGEWALYLAACVGFMSTTITTFCRSLISKLVGQFEVGAMFSVLAAIQALVPMAAIPFYGFLYKSTVASFPATFLVLLSGLYVVCTCLLLVVKFGLKTVDARKQVEESQVEM